MKRALKVLAVLALTAFSLYSVILIYRTSTLAKTKDFSVFIVQNPFLAADAPYILKAYKSVLDEEGVAYKVVNDTVLLSLDLDSVLRNTPVIIFPDSIAQTLPEDLRSFIITYLNKGGNVVIVYDAGTKDTRGARLRETIFADIISINYITSDSLKEEAYNMGRFSVHKQNLDLFQIPAGKIYEGSLMGGSPYGKLKYPVAKTELRRGIKKEEIYAELITEAGKKYPAVVMKKYGRGRVLYVNLPLGRLKASSDDFPLRSMLRAFLFNVVKIPHLMNTNYGRGGLSINWHIDSSLDRKNISEVIKEDYFRKEIEYSFHISAGDFRDAPGDGLGFDACGTGRDHVILLSDYGTIGSHGGWASNWFSENITKGAFHKKEIYEYIKKNNDCLELISGQKVLEYSAPNGTHPQPATTRILEKLGVTAYFYTGDAGSPPNRTFADGKMVSGNVIAFPAMTFGRFASIPEMKKAGMPEKDIKNQLIKTVNYLTDSRTVSLVYFHPDDIRHYPDAFRSFLDHAVQQQGQGKLEIRSMTYFSEFTRRFLKTKFSFQIKTDSMVLNLENMEGLEGIAVAIPKDMYNIPIEENVEIGEDEAYYYLTIKENIIYNDINIPRKNKI